MAWCYSLTLDPQGNFLHTCSVSHVPKRSRHPLILYSKTVFPPFLIVAMTITLTCLQETKRAYLPSFYQCCKEQYCIGAWNVRSKNQVVSKETARVNIKLLRISERKWMGMGKFKSDDYCIYYCGQEYLILNGVALILNKRVQNAVFECNLQNRLPWWLRW